VPPPPLGATDLGEQAADVFVDFERNHPVLKFAALDKVNVFKARPVALVEGSPVRTLARTKQGPAILEVTDTDHRAIVVPFFNQTSSDWPFDLGFVAFLLDAVRYLSDVQGGTLGDELQPGGTLATRLPKGARDISLETPLGAADDGGRERVDLEPAPDGTISFAPVRRVGVYTLTWTGIGGATDLSVNAPTPAPNATNASSLPASPATGRFFRTITANLLDPIESDIAARTDLPMARQIVAADTRSERTRRYWPYLLLSLLGVIMLEWWVYNRKVAL
jgi:hypothetical protein